jgi:hypothetical protein
MVIDIIQFLTFCRGFRSRFEKFMDMTKSNTAFVKEFERQIEGDKAKLREPLTAKAARR